MADALTIDVSSLLKGVEKLKTIPAVLTQRLDDVLTANASDIATKAEGLATVGVTGLLHGTIRPNNEKPLEKHITVNAFYAPFIEFGTGKFAAQYVGSLPADWQAYAAQFKGKKGEGDFQDFYHNMIKWVMAKGIHGKTKSDRSKKGKKAEAQAAAIAYMMCLSIIKKGIKAQPFLYPAYAEQKEKIKRDVEAVLKSL